MFEEKLLRELAAVEATGPILSLYLDVDPKKRTAEEYKLTLREMMKQIEGEVDPADSEAVQRYITLEYDWSGRGLIIFSRQAENIWYALALSVPVRSGVTVARKPYISPLVELDGLYGRYAVILVDRQGAHFHLFQMGEIIAEDGAMGEEIRGLRKRGGSSMIGMRGGAPSLGRKEAAIVQRNLRESAKALSAFCQKHHPRRLLLAGSEHTVAQFQEVLPAHLREAVAGTFISDMDAGKVEIREHSLKILQKLEEERKKALVEAVITAAAKGANGVIRLDGTLSAAHEGRIQVLVVERDYHEPGYRCSGCGYLTTQKLGKCPFCNAAFTEIPDAAEAVVTQTIEKGGAVEVVDNDALGQTRIGALLRY